MAFGLVSAACGGDEVCEENLERLRLLQLEFVSIEPGVFAMGTSGAQAQYLRQREMWDELSRAEQPVREVVIERGVYLGKYEVTQAQWTAAMGPGRGWLRSTWRSARTDRRSTYRGATRRISCGGSTSERVWKKRFIACRRKPSGSTRAGRGVVFQRCGECAVGFEDSQ